jgi:hypothetical protein
MDMGNNISLKKNKQKEAKHFKTAWNPPPPPPPPPHLALLFVSSGCSAD